MVVNEKRKKFALIPAICRNCDRWIWLERYTYTGLHDTGGIRI